MEAFVGIVVGGLALLLFVAWIWLVVRAFKAGGFGWGMVMLLVPSLLGVIGGMVFASAIPAGMSVLSVPVLGYIHVQRNDGDGKRAFLLTLPGVAAIATVAVLSAFRIGGFGAPS